MSLLVKNLVHLYEGGNSGLKGVDLTIERGRKFVLLGANGAGKTTLLLHFAGVLKPQKGSIFLDGAPLNYTRQGLIALRSRLCLVFQDPDDQLFAPTVFQDVSFGPLNLGLDTDVVRRRVEASLAALDIEDLSNRPTCLLSWGQKKKVAIAGALAMEPEYLVLDEPTAGLDMEGTDSLLAVLDLLAQRGTTLIISTNDTEFAFGFADEAAVLADGRTVRQGAPEDVLSDGSALSNGCLRMPLVLEVGQYLRHCHLTTGSLPRQRHQLMAALKAAFVLAPGEEIKAVVR